MVISPSLRRCLVVAALSTTLLTTGCANRQTREPNPDPLEKVNRVTFAFNQTADKYVLRPVAKGYTIIMPDPFERGIRNFFRNLTYPVVIVNDLLQAKFKQAASDTGRLLVNSTVGIGGLFDPATSVGLVRHEEDFGQTLAVWGVPQGPYLVVPFFGPFTFRSGTGTLVDVYGGYNPLVEIHTTAIRDRLFALYYLDQRAGLIGPDELLNEAFDPYLFLRDTYLQNREFLVYDGNPPQDDFGDEFDEDFDDEFEDFEE